MWAFRPECARWLYAHGADWAPWLAVQADRAVAGQCVSGRHCDRSATAAVCGCGVECGGLVAVN